MNNLVRFSSLLNTLETVNQAEINMNSKMGESLYKLGRYNRVFLEIWAQILIWAPMLKQWAVGSFFLAKIRQKSSQGPTKILFFKWEKWWSWWLRMTNVFILCNLLWKVQKRLAVNREGRLKNNTEKDILKDSNIFEIHSYYSIFI